MCHNGGGFERMLFRMYQRRVVGLVLSIAALGLILGAVATRTWWIAVEHRDEARIGLRSAEQCTLVMSRRYWDYESEGQRPEVTRCEDGTLRAWLRGDLDPDTLHEWDDTGSLGGMAEGPRRVPATFVFLGTLVFIAGIGAIVAIGVTVVTTGRAAPPGRPLPTVAAVTTGGFAGLALAFVVSAPDALDALRPGPGLLLALAGAAAGVAGTLLLGRGDAARDPTAAVLADADRAAPVGRAPALIAGAIGVALVLGSIFTYGWFRGRDDTMRLGVGVQDAEVCLVSTAGSECELRTIPGDVRHAKQPTRMRVFLAAGTMTWWTGLGAVIAFVLVAGLVALRQAIGGGLGLARVLYLAAGSFGASALVYVLSKPDEANEVSVSYGAFVALGGAGALIGAAVMVGRWVAAMEMSAPPAVLPEGSVPVAVPPPPPLAPPSAPSPFARPHAPPELLAAMSAPATATAAPAPVIPPCPKCGTPMLWVTARNGYMCTVCRTRD